MSFVKEHLKRLSHYLKNHPIVEMIVVFSIGVIFIGTTNLLLGWGMMSGDSKLYSSVSYQLGREGWIAFENRGISFYYRLFPSLLWVCRWISEDHWKAVFSVFQCVVCGGYFLGVFQLSKQVFKKSCVAWSAILLLFPLYEFWNWSRYVLTDIIFSTSLIWFLFFSLRFQYESRRSTSLILAVFFLSIVVIIRPVGFFAIVSILLYGGYSFSKAKVSPFVGTGVVVGLISLIVMCAIGSFMALPDNFSFGPYAFFRSLYEQGVVVHDRSFYDIDYPEWLQGNSFGVFCSYLFLFVARFVIFWSPVIKGYSIMHLFFNLISLLPVYAFSFFKSSSSGKSFLWITLLSFTTFHSLTLIDYDHRYRVPLLGILVVLAAGGIGRFFVNVPFLSSVKKNDQ